MEVRDCRVLRRERRLRQKSDADLGTVRVQSCAELLREEIEMERITNLLAFICGTVQRAASQNLAKNPVQRQTTRTSAITQ